MIPFSPQRYTDEAKAVGDLARALPWDAGRAARVVDQARGFIRAAQLTPPRLGGIEQFLKQYRLNSEEGLALVGLAECLLRIPDTATRNALINEKITAADWLSAQLETSDLIVRAARVGLFITKATLNSLVAKLGEPTIRAATEQAIKILGTQFVLGETMRAAINNAVPDMIKGYAVSFDMLGEGARTHAMADRYMASYMGGITDLAGARDQVPMPVKSRMGISVKLSALYPRYRPLQEQYCRPVLVDRLLTLAREARRYDLNLTIDAEETERLTLSLAIIADVARDPSLYGWDGLGLAVQAYQKYAPALIDHVLDLGRDTRHRLRVRLIKGAYWDSEIKRAQVLGLPDYPLFTRKANTDLSYLVCAHQLLRAGDAVYPMFGTHNAHTAAAVLDLASVEGRGIDQFELQRLHGMGEALHNVVTQEDRARSTIYGPVGVYADLLAYLVRRLMENGANTSFVHQLTLKSDAEIADPYHEATTHATRRHRDLPLPKDLFGAGRVNSRGYDIEQLEERALLLSAPIPSLIKPLVTSSLELEQIVARAGAAWPAWNAMPGEARAEILEKCADLLEAKSSVFIHLLQIEGRKTLADAVSEVREAVDFARYYAHAARSQFTPTGTLLPGPTGEENRLILGGRGVFVCISPWNFPLAIFAGQITAALAAGNTVIAKPAEQTPLIAAHMVNVLHQAGVPRDALHLVVGDGQVGATLVAHKAIAGVAFTGSTVVAQSINRTLANKNGPIVPLIAETGGQNAMIVDSTALLEAACDDIITSAFGSAGQRCSALRVLFVQRDVANDLLDMLSGALSCLRLGDPQHITTDIGPVIDQDAFDTLQNHLDELTRQGARLIARAPLPQHVTGPYIAPALYEIDRIDQLRGEVFGPILHVIRYDAGTESRVIEAVNCTGFGLTFGAHSRLYRRLQNWAGLVRAGNIYLNRSMIGAVVGSQPFGGQGLSGTGPKAGGPHYLLRFATERVISTNTAAAGGNIALIAGGD